MSSCNFSTIPHDWSVPHLTLALFLLILCKHYFPDAGANMLLAAESAGLSSSTMPVVYGFFLQAKSASLQRFSQSCSSSHDVVPMPLTPNPASSSYDVVPMPRTPNPAKSDDEPLIGLAVPSPRSSSPASSKQEKKPNADDDDCFVEDGIEESPKTLSECLGWHRRYVRHENAVNV